MTISWPLSRQSLVDASGRPLLVPSVQFYAAGTTTPLGVFKDAALSVPHVQPIVADGTGRFPRVFIPSVLYAEEVKGPYGELLWRDDGMGFVPTTSAGGSGGGASIDSNALAATGDVKWRMDGGLLPGWVRLNGRTLGSAGSGASELADASARALYVYLWQNFAEDLASVVGGRGSSATGDFSAGKPLVLPSMRGLLPAGLDDMGNTAAQVLQAAMTLNLTAGSAQANVINSAPLSIGMLIFAPGVSAGTFITDIVGNTISMSAPAAAGSSGDVIGRFGQLDAQRPGAVGGLMFNRLLARNLPSAMPGGKVTVTYPAHGYRSPQEGNQGVSVGAGGTSGTANRGGNDSLTNPPQPVEHAVTIANPNGDRAFAVVQPTRVGTFYIKL